MLCINTAAAPYVNWVFPLPYARFLLCSDGLSKALEDSTLAAILADGQPKIVAEKLLEAALSRNAADNVTAVVVDPV